MSDGVRQPIEVLMDQVVWTEVDTPDELHDGDLYATHSGVLSLAGFQLRVHQLNNGQRVIDATDMANFLHGIEGRQ